MSAQEPASTIFFYRCARVADRLAFADCWIAGTVSVAVALVISLPIMAANTARTPAAEPLDGTAHVAPAVLDKSQLPRVMSTNLCADMLLLGLADASQIVSVSSRSQDPQRSSLADMADQFASNEASAEEVIAGQPDIVLASRRWQAQHQARLFERFGISIINVPFPKDWAGIFDSLKQVGEAIGQQDKAAELIADTRHRLHKLEKQSVPVSSALYLRGNGGTAASDTYIDALFQALGITNQAGQYGVTGWGRVSLESIVLDPPDAFLLSSTEHDASLARSGVTRHPLLRELLRHKPVLSLNNLDTGCSDWRQVETVENLAAEFDRQFSVSAQGSLP